MSAQADPQVQALQDIAATLKLILSALSCMQDKTTPLAVDISGSTVRVQS